MLQSTCSARDESFSHEARRCLQRLELGRAAALRAHDGDLFMVIVITDADPPTNSAIIKLHLFRRHLGFLVYAPSLRSPSNAFWTDIDFTMDARMRSDSSSRSWTSSTFANATPRSPENFNALFTTGRDPFASVASICASSDAIYRELFSIPQSIIFVSIRQNLALPSRFGYIASRSG